MTQENRPFINPVSKALTDAVTVAGVNLRTQSRARSWLITASSTGFFFVAPLVFMGRTIIGENGERLAPFTELSGYTNYTGYLAVPLCFAFLTNSAYSNIGQRIRGEQQSGTLERLLISLKYPFSMLLGVLPTDVVYSLEAGTAPAIPPCGRR